jgi:hypothetical protein
MAVEAPASLSVREAAALRGRDRTRAYALVHSGDLVAAPAAEGEHATLRIERSSGGPRPPRNAWAIIGLASGDDALRERTLGLLPRTAAVATRTRRRSSAS